MTHHWINRRDWPNSNPGAKAMLAGATVLAGAAALVGYQTHAAETDHPARGSFVTVDGVRLRYLERGHGPTVVFIHGTGVSAEDFDVGDLLSATGERHRAIAIDRPGFGYSKRPWMRTWSASAQAALLHDAFASLGLEKPIVVGHSWGALVALALAADYPDDIAGLVLISGYYYPTTRIDVALFSPAAVPVIGDLMRYTISPLLGRAAAPELVKKMFSPEAVPAAFEQHVPIALMTRPSQIRAAAEDAVHMTSSAQSLSPRYSEIRCPMTIIAGEADTIVKPEEQSRRLNQEVRHSKLVMCAGAGHMLHHTNAPRVLEEIDALTPTVETERQREAQL